MFRKAMYIALLFGALLGIANSLSCFNCSTTSSCSNPGLQVCDNSTAIINIEWLTSIYMGVSYINVSNSFECLLLPFWDNGSSLHQFAGCVFRDIDYCSLPQQSDREVIHCHTCNWDYCNRNAANSFDKSNSIKLIASLALILFNLFKCAI